MSNAVVNNDDKRHNGKEDIAYLAVDLRIDSTTGWETSPGCIHNHAKPWEDEKGFRRRGDKWRLGRDWIRW